MVRCGCIVRFLVGGCSGSLGVKFFLFAPGCVLAGVTCHVASVGWGEGGSVWWSFFAFVWERFLSPLRVLSVCLTAFKRGSLCLHL